MVRSMLKRLVQTAAIIALLTGTAAAQIPMSFPTDSKRTMTPDEIEKQKAVDKAYKSAVDKIPEKKPVADPWGTVRPSPPAAAQNKQSSQNKQ